MSNCFERNCKRGVYCVEEAEFSKYDWKNIVDGLLKYVNI